MMGIPSFILDFFAALMLAVAAVSAARLIADRPWRRGIADADADAAHVLMGIAMAGMLVTSLRTLPAGIWAAVFAAAAGWYAWQLFRSYQASSPGAAQRAAIAAHRHSHVPHLAMCGAMVYMLLAAPAAMSSGGDMTGATGMGASAGGARFPVLALVLMMILVGFVALDTDRLSRLPRVAPVLAVNPRVEAGLAAARAGMSSGIALEPDDQEPPGGTAGTDGDGSGPHAATVLPRLALCCQIAMGATMAYMLVLML